MSDDKPRCQKCRHLHFSIAIPEFTCDRGRDVGTAPDCPDYSDCSRQKEFFVNYRMGRDH